MSNDGDGLGRHFDIRCPMSDVVFWTQQNQTKGTKNACWWRARTDQKMRRSRRKGALTFFIACGAAPRGISSASSFPKLTGGGRFNRIKPRNETVPSLFPSLPSVQKKPAKAVWGLKTCKPIPPLSQNQHRILSPPLPKPLTSNVFRKPAPGVLPSSS